MQPYNAFTTPQWNAPPQNAGQAVVNTDPFDKTGTVKPGAKLSAGASSFKPNTDGKGPSPIRVLNRNSTADDQQPTIVTSPTVNDAKDKSNGKGVSQQPIGTRNGNVTPSRPKVVFTTDVGPGLDYRGGHYVKLEHVEVSQVDGHLKCLSEEVSAACPVPFRTSSLTYMVVRLGPQAARPQGATTEQGQQVADLLLLLRRHRRRSQVRRGRRARQRADDSQLHHPGRVRRRSDHPRHSRAHVVL